MKKTLEKLGELIVAYDNQDLVALKSSNKDFEGALKSEYLRTSAEGCFIDNIRQIFYLSMHSFFSESFNDSDRNDARRNYEMMVNYLK